MTHAHPEKLYSSEVCTGDDAKCLTRVQWREDYEMFQGPLVLHIFLFVLLQIEAAGVELRTDVRLHR